MSAEPGSHNYCFVMVMRLRKRLILYGHGHIKTAEQRITLAVDGWAVTFSTAMRGLSGAVRSPPRPLIAVPNITAHSSTASCSLPTS